MKLTVAHTNDPDTDAAAAELVEQCRERLGDAKPVAGIFFAAVDAEHEPMLAAIMDAFPDLALIGCTTDGEVSSALEFQEDSMGLALFSGDGLRARAGIGTALAANPTQAAEAAVGAALLDGEHARLCITLPESLTVSAVSTVSALTKALPEGVPLVGGTAGDQWRFERTKQFCGRETHSDSLPVLMLYGDFHFGIGVASGWSPIGESGKVTKAESNVVYEIEGESALAFFRRHFGDHVEPSPEFPLRVVDVDRAEAYLRAPMSYDPENETVTFAGDVPTGSSVQITGAGRDGIVDGARQSVEQARADLGDAKPGGALLVSCAARKQLLGTRTGKEHDILRECLGEDVPMLGFYSYGEIAPQGGHNVSDFHNETCVTVLLGA